MSLFRPAPGTLLLAALPLLAATPPAFGGDKGLSGRLRSTASLELRVLRHSAGIESRALRTQLRSLAASFRPASMSATATVQQGTDRFVQHLINLRALAGASTASVMTAAASLMAQFQGPIGADFAVGGGGVLDVFLQRRDQELQKVLEKGRKEFASFLKRVAQRGRLALSHVSPTALNLDLYAPSVTGVTIIENNVQLLAIVSLREQGQTLATIFVRALGVPAQDHGIDLLREGQPARSQTVTANGQGQISLDITDAPPATGFVARLYNNPFGAPATVLADLAAFSTSP